MLRRGQRRRGGAGGAGRHRPRLPGHRRSTESDHEAAHASRLRVLDLVLPVVVAIVALALSALSSQLTLSVSSAAIAFVAVSGAVAAIVALAVNRYGGGALPAMDAATLESLTLLRNGLIAQDDDVAELERTVQCSQVWIITPDLHKDIGEESFSDVVEHNVKRRGICYTWLVPSSCSGIGAKKSRLLSAYSEEERRRIKFVELSDAQWHQLPYTSGDLAIYNPTFDPPLTPTTVYIEYPDAERALWIRVFPPVIEQWIDQIEEVVPDIRTVEVSE